MQNRTSELATRRGGRLLPVLTERVDAEEPWERVFVDCPRRGRIGLEDCVDCAHFFGLAMLGRRCRPFARCVFQAEAPRRAQLRLLAR